MILAQDFIKACLALDYTFFTGVPCSFLKPLINYTITGDKVDYVAATSEGEAVGIACGAHIAGRKAVVMCQNSGLGNTVNPLTSLNFPFRIPLLLIVTLRGEPGHKDEPQHELMGQITSSMLDTLRIPWAFFPDTPEKIVPFLKKAQDSMSTNSLPYAFIMRNGDVAEEGLNSVVKRDHAVIRENITGCFECDCGSFMQRFEAIQTICDNISSEDVVVATTGKIGRELYTVKDTDNQMYVVGSMGCASGLGFGIQHVLPHKRVVVLDGDGAALMKMGSMATIGHNKPDKFIHIILDNEAYESTGGQSTVSASVDFCRVAAACGYSWCCRVDTKASLEKSIRTAADKEGPALIHIKVAGGSSGNLSRPAIKPHQVKERLMNFLNSAENL